MFLLSENYLDELIMYGNYLEKTGKSIQCKESCVLQVEGVKFEKSNKCLLLVIRDQNRKLQDCVLKLDNKRIVNELNYVQQEFMASKDENIVIKMLANNYAELLTGTLVKCEVFSVISVKKYIEEYSLDEEYKRELELKKQKHLFVLDEFYVLGKKELDKRSTFNSDKRIEKNDESWQRTHRLSQLTMMYSNCTFVIKVIVLFKSETKDINNKIKATRFLLRDYYDDNDDDDDQNKKNEEFVYVEMVALEDVVYHDKKEIDALEPNNVYLLKSGILRESKQNNRVESYSAWPYIEKKCNFEIYINQYTQIRHVKRVNITERKTYAGMGEVQKRREKFTRLNRLLLERPATGSRVNVIGIVIRIDECKKLEIDQDEAEEEDCDGKTKFVSLRNVFIQDTSEHVCRVSLWRRDAEMFKMKIGSMIMVYNASVKYGSSSCIVTEENSSDMLRIVCTLNVGGSKKSSYIQVKENCENGTELCKELREWWKKK